MAEAVDGCGRTESFELRLFDVMKTATSGSLFLFHGSDFAIAARLADYAPSRRHRSSYITLVLRLALVLLVSIFSL